MTTPDYEEFQAISEFAYDGDPSDLVGDWESADALADANKNKELSDIERAFSTEAISKATGISADYLTSLEVSVAIDQTTGKAVLGFGGTNRMADFLADWDIANNVPPEQMEKAYDIGKAFTEIARDMGFEAYTTGHSLGGALAQAASAAGGINAVTYDAPGVRNELKAVLSARGIPFNGERGQVLFFAFSAHSLRSV